MVADDYFGFDDALYDACRLVSLVSKSGRPLSEMVAEFPVYVSTPEIRIDVTEEQKWDLVEQAVAHFKQSHDVIDVDGARVLFGDGWALLRASNTQPAVVARIEAKTEQRLTEIREEVSSWLATQGVSLP
jgi:phosphomannomutase/phosphoglucomutase